MLAQFDLLIFLCICTFLFYMYVCVCCLYTKLSFYWTKKNRLLILMINPYQKYVLYKTDLKSIFDILV